MEIIPHNYPGSLSSADCIFNGGGNMQEQITSRTAFLGLLFVVLEKKKLTIIIKPLTNNSTSQKAKKQRKHLLKSISKRAEGLI